MHAMTTPHPSAHTLMQLLWSIDPMGTGCTDNPGMEDEYWSQARDMAEELEQGKDPRPAITEVFDFYFWEDCLLSGTRQDKLDQLVAAIAGLSR